MGCMGLVCLLDRRVQMEPGYLKGNKVLQCPGDCMGCMGLEYLRDSKDSGCMVC